MFTIKVRPNPVDDILTVAGLAPGSHLCLIDAAGKVVANVITTHTTQEIDMRALTRAAYILQVLYDNKMVKSVQLIKN
ncbi:T9SS type A sorting domain-containing protein [Pseudoflavitalea sp. X16]|uniref:T9SS type A sorting domain-containing protein n=1 Tax=Paraflavitalea devenefica TaxID=2716334 RepID=UPI00142441C8|nr:T9SS type A sorting domain-containing protein [Paraflavitalea devenefica]NII28877.1 T9SS type A sorting domain-containing protein [Paraflavitalea devenefica]